MSQCPRDEVADEATNSHPDCPERVLDDQLVVDLYLEGEECAGDKPDEDIGDKRQQPTHRRKDE